MSLQNQGQWPGQGQGAGLPFQQINPNMQRGPGIDAQLQQRINERNNLDVAYGGQPMHNAPNQAMPSMPMMPAQMPQIPVQAPARGGSLNVHPATIHKFLSMDAASQQRLAQKNPQFVQQIMDTIARQQPQQPPPQQQLPAQPQNDETVSNVSNDESIDTPNSSDTDNDHSSDEEHESRAQTKKRPEPTKKQDRPRQLRIQHNTTTNQNVQIQGKNLFLSLDFRNDLTETNHDCYVLSFPVQHNVTCLELESCLINRNPVLEREPYIYMAIEELSGDYQVNTSHQTHHVFGKLIQEKTVNEFIVYKPENCIKNLPRPSRIDRLSITFYRYDMTPIPLNRLAVERLSRSKDYLKVTTKAPHYLAVGDRVNINQSQDDLLSVDMVDVIKVLRPDIVALDNPVNRIGSGSNLQFEKVDLKCTLTFRLHST